MCTGAMYFRLFTSMCSASWRPGEALDSLGLELTDFCKLPCGARIRTQNLWKAGPSLQPPASLFLTDNNSNEIAASCGYWEAKQSDTLWNSVQVAMVKQGFMGITFSFCCCFSFNLFFSGCRSGLEFSQGVIYNSNRPEGEGRPCLLPAWGPLRR